MRNDIKDWMMCGRSEYIHLCAFERRCFTRETYVYFNYGFINSNRHVK